MNREAKNALEYAIKRALPVLDQFSKSYSDHQLIWTKKDGHWSGRYVQKPDLVLVYRAAGDELEGLSAEFAKRFSETHPEYIDSLVGCGGVGALSNISKNQTEIVRRATCYLWEREGSFNCDSNSISKVVEEFEEFVDSENIRVRFHAQLLNFDMDADTVQLPENLMIRRLSEAEISKFHGGSLIYNFNQHATGQIHEFVIEGEFDDKKVFTHIPEEAKSAQDRIRCSLDKAMRSLRTFKSGPIGYERVHFSFQKFCPLLLPVIGYLDLYVPIGLYKIPRSEIGGLSEHAKNIFSVSDAAMEAACSRLADAELRVRPQDKILDAIIGMEALLLAGHPSEDRRGELRFRFSLHYSTLFDLPIERHRAFKEAKGLYDLRSSIAHGDTPTDAKIAGQKLTLHDAARLSTDSLRKIIRRFLGEGKSAQYRKPEFWERAYFGIAQEEKE